MWTKDTKVVPVFLRNMFELRENVLLEVLNRSIARMSKARLSICTKKPTSLLDLYLQRWEVHK
jgi:hypothetical protein